MTDKALAARLREHAKPLRRSGQMTHDHIADDLDRAADLIEQRAQAESVGWMWQHDETGRIGFVDQWNLDNGWADQNPRCRIVGAIYLAPPAQEPLSNEPIFDLAEPFGAFRHGDAQGDKRIEFARAIEKAVWEKNGG